MAGSHQYLIDSDVIRIWNDDDWTHTQERRKKVWRYYIYISGEKKRIFFFKWRHMNKFFGARRRHLYARQSCFLFIYTRIDIDGRMCVLGSYRQEEEESSWQKENKKKSNKNIKKKFEFKCHKSRAEPFPFFFQRRTKSSDVKEVKKKKRKKEVIKIYA